MTIELKDKLYTSTEVANILGVSLRSVYRYLDEDKLHADVKTATGRHRFSKQNILDFLYPQDNKDSKTMLDEDTRTVNKPITPKKPKTAVIEEKLVTEETLDVVDDSFAFVDDEEYVKDDDLQIDTKKSEKEETVQDDAVDWLAKFRAAAERYREEQTTKVDEPVVHSTKQDETPSSFTKEPASAPSITNFAKEYEEDVEEKTEYYYLSGVGGLKEIAQSLDKAGKKASVDYAFTLDAGLSLFKPIRPFSVIHAYVRSNDRDYFEKALKLTEVSKSSAQLCLYISDDSSIYKEKREMYGLNVVSRDRLRMDLVAAGEKELVSELDTIA